MRKRKQCKIVIFKVVHIGTLYCYNDDETKGCNQRKRLTKSQSLWTAYKKRYELPLLQ